MENVLYDAFHERCKELTGDAWCPYASSLMMEIVLKVDDDTAKALIEERRTYTFPQFLSGDPMLEKLISLL